MCGRTDGGDDGDGVQEAAGEVPLLVTTVVVVVVMLLSSVPAANLRRHVHLVSVPRVHLLCVRLKNVARTMPTPRERTTYTPRVRIMHTSWVYNPLARTTVHLVYVPP